MAVAYAGIATVDTAGSQMTENSVVFAASGGTLDDSNNVQLTFDLAVFTGTDAKQRLLAAVELIKQRIETAKVWPVTTAS